MPAYKDSRQGTWYASFYFENWQGVKQKKLKRGFATKKDALAWEREFLLQQAADLTMTFEGFVEIYITDKKKRLRENTWSTKEHIIRTKILPYFKEKRLSEIKPRDVIAWQNEMLNYRDKNGKAYSPTYLKTLHGQLSAILNHAVRFYGLKSNAAATAGCMGSEKHMGTAAAWHITSSLYGQTAASTLSYPFWLQAIAIAVACTGFVILFNVHGWGRCLCALGGVVTWMAYLLCGELGLGPYGANFIAAAVAAVYAEGMARARKYPVTSYQVISAVPLLPGAGIYYTMSLGLNGSTQLALQRGFATAGIAGSIAAAILLVSSVVRLFTAQRKK